MKSIKGIRRDNAKTERSTGDWFQTYTGKAWWPTDPRPDDVCIEDIAHGLALQCRYNGQCRVFYSVAQHSVLVAHAVSSHGREAEIAGLLHDAVEAYLGDLVRPLKRQLPLYYDLERKNQEAIYMGLGIAFFVHERWDAEVKDADMRMLAAERRDLMAPPPMPWDSLEQFEPVAGKIIPWTPRDAEGALMEAFQVLMGENA